jgi:protoheme IX farnesyltransferase
MAASDSTLRRISRNIRCRLRLYWQLIKSLQTGLLLFTGVAGYMSARCPVTTWHTLLGLTGSLFLAISGSTVLNMWYDRDIDAKMERTANRPIPSGQISPPEALILGLTLALLGVGGAVALDPLFGLIVFAGLFFDVVIYTIWLKRRTAWGIVWGGIAGGMPILAGRALGIGTIDWIGLLLALAILFWIPTHILTFSMRYYEDYKRAGIPSFPSTYGFRATRLIIAFSSIVAAMMIAAAAIGIGMDWGYLRLLGVLSIGLLFLAIIAVTRPSRRVNFGLFKYASLYMMSSMLLLVVDVVR